MWRSGRRLRTCSVAPCMRPSSRCREPMRKRYLVGFAILLAVAALTPFIRRKFSPALLVISVGINDAIAPDSQPFAEAYPEIVRRARALAGKVFVVSLAPIANSGSIANRVDRSRLPDVGQTIRQTAGEYSIPVIDVSALNTRGSALSDDGVHLSRDGSMQWTSIIENAISRQCP